MSLRGIADAVLALLLAPPCAICGRVLQRPLDGAVCEPCWASITLCPTTFRVPHIADARAIGLYDGTLRELIHALKYDGRRSVGPHLSRLMHKYGDEVLRGADAIVPVPLHRRRYRQRGFNQAEDLARELGLPVERLLRRVRATQPQVDLPAEHRRENVHGAFALRGHLLGGHGTGVTGRGLSRARRLFGPPKLEDKVVVLVDDVATTGATLQACARVLIGAGVNEVRALTAARVASALPQRRRA